LVWDGKKNQVFLAYIGSEGRTVKWGFSML